MLAGYIDIKNISLRIVLQYLSSTKQFIGLWGVVFSSKIYVGVQIPTFMGSI